MGNFAKLAARDISVIVSSGDSGSGYLPYGTCYDPSTQTKDTAVDQGTIAERINVSQAWKCCISAGDDVGSKASWSYVQNDVKSGDGDDDSEGGTCLIYSSVT